MDREIENLRRNGYCSETLKVRWVTVPAFSSGELRDYETLNMSLPSRNATQRVGSLLRDLLADLASTLKTLQPGGRLGFATKQTLPPSENTEGRLCPTRTASAGQTLVFQNWLNGFVREDKSESAGSNGVRSKSTGRASGTLLQRLARRLRSRSEPRRFRSAAPRLAAVERVEDRCLLAAFVVDTVVDESDGDLSAGDLSLREAIEAANAQAGADTISFSPTVFGTAQTIDLVLGEFAITDELTITGPGRDLLTIDAQGNSRHFNIDDGDENSDMEVTISGVALTNGHATDGNDAVVSDEDRGGAVFAQDYLRLLSVRMHQNVAASIGGALILRGGGSISDSAFTDNSAGAGGGGLYLDGTTQLLRSEVLRNSATGGEGGGLVNFGESVIHSSTIGENSASRGGGLWNRNGHLSLAGSIVSSNSAAEGGGIGVRNFTSAEINNSTIIQNQAGEGAGVFIQGRDTDTSISSTTIYGNQATGGFGGELGGGISSRESVTPITNSIIAGNVDGDGNPNDTEGTRARGSYNLIGDPGTAGWYEHGVNNNIVGQNDGSGGRQTLDLSTVLGPLADNGGFTQTHALLPGSIAVDAGDPNFDPNTFDPPLTTDQRGGSFSRLANAQQTLTARVDLGAFELQPAAATVELSTNGQNLVVDENGSTSVDLRLTQAPASNVVVQFNHSHAEQLEISRSEFTFTQSNWNQFQTVTLSGIPNPQRTDDVVATISVDVVDAASDDAFDAAGGTFDVTIVDVPLTPEVTAPTGDIRNSLPTITWREIPEAVSYELWLERIGDDSGPVVNPTITETSFSVSLTLGRYRAWVRANLSDNSRTGWATQTFGVSSPTAVSIAAGDVEPTRPYIAWNELAGATGYRVYIRNQTSGEVEVDTIVSETQFRPSTDLTFGQHHIWVRGVGPGNYQGAWSRVERHSVGPKLVSPVISTFESQPTFSWTALEGIASYQLYVQRGRDVVINESSITSTSYTHSQSFESGLHRWWIRPYAADGKAGGWTARGDFYVGGRTTIEFAFAFEDQISGPWIQWEPVDGADSYEVYLFNDDDGVVAQRRQNITDTSFFADPVPHGNYRVWVRPLRENAPSGFWSQPRSFSVDFATTDTSVTPVRPLGPMLNSLQTFEWTAAPGVSEYALYLTDGETVIQESLHFRTSWTPRVPLEGVWNWWVRANETPGRPGPWSERQVFDATGRATITGPAEASSNRTPTITWSSVIGATHYIFQLDNISTGQNSILRDDEVLTDSYAIPTALQPGQYRVWVRAMNNLTDVNAPWSKAFLFEIV